jgi:hypothetical protein
MIMEEISEKLVYDLNKVLELGFKTGDKVRVTMLPNTLGERFEHDKGLLRFRKPGAEMDELRRGGIYNNGLSLHGVLIVPISESEFHDCMYLEEMDNDYLILEFGSLDEPFNNYPVEFGAIEGMGA